MGFIDIVIIIILILLITGNLSLFNVGSWLTIVLVIILVIWIIKILL